IRRRFLNARIELIGLPWAASFVERFAKHLDGYIEFPGFPGLPKRPDDIARWPAFLQEMQQRSFDLLIQMHGSGRIVNSMCQLFGVKTLAGYYPAGDDCSHPSTFIEYPSVGCEVDRQLELTRFLGATTDDV